MDFKKIIFIMLLLSAMLILAACGEPGDKPCTSHADSNSDGKCDECGAAVEIPAPECTEHVDANGDEKCDVCGETVEPEIPACDTHIDIKNDGQCDVCERAIDDEKLQYTVYVKDEDGNPIAGVKIQICVGDSCLSVRDYMSDENGRFTRRVTNKNNETVKIMVNEASAEYEYDPTVYVASFEDGSYELELTLKKKLTQ